MKASSSSTRTCTAGAQPTAGVWGEQQKAAAPNAGVMQPGRRNEPGHRVLRGMPQPDSDTGGSCDPPEWLTGTPQRSLGCLHERHGRRINRVCHLHSSD
jgi:hypothetical protein